MACDYFLFHPAGGEETNIILSPPPNDNVIITISLYIESSDIVRAVYSGIFKHIQEHSAIFSHGQAY